MNDHRIDRRHFVAAGAAFAAAPLAARAARLDPLGAYFNMPPGGPANARVIQPQPDRLVTDGKILAGAFERPPRDSNLLEADLFQGGARGAWHRKRLMEWFGYGLRTPDWYLGTIIIDAKFLPIASVYLVNRRDKTSFSHDLTAGRVKIARNPWDDRTWARGPGYSVEFVHHLAEGKNEIIIDARMPRKPRVRGRITLTEDLVKMPALSAVVPTVPPHFFYTHKACMPAGGELEIGGEKITLDPGRDLAILDEHRNYAQAPAIWTWGTAGGSDDQGRFLAFNLGDTGGIDQQRWNENCLWVEDRLELLGPVVWTLDRKKTKKPWTVKDQAGRVDLTFTPQNGKDVNVPPLGRYFQMSGHYRGFVKDAAGEKRMVEDFYGCAENGHVG